MQNSAPITATTFHSNVALGDIVDFIEASPSIGETAVLFQALSASWVTEYLYDQWAPLGREGFVDAHSALARVITVSAFLGSTNVRDIAQTLGLPTGFVRVCLFVLEAGSWRTSLLPELTLATTDSAGFARTKELVDNFLLSELEVSVHWVHLLEALGPEVVGQGSSACRPRPIE
jgi:hypothetical protein